MLAWEARWDIVDQANKLKIIKNDIELWLNMTKLSKKDVILLTRLRLGHTKITQSHLMDRSPPPLCNCESLFSVKYNFEDCIIHINIKKKENEIDGLSSLSNFINQLNLYHLI